MGGLQAGARYVSLLQSVQTTSGQHPACYPTGIRSCFPWPKHESDHSPLSGVKVQKM